MKINKEQWESYRGYVENIKRGIEDKSWRISEKNRDKLREVVSVFERCYKHKYITVHEAVEVEKADMLYNNRIDANIPNVSNRKEVEKYFEKNEEIWDAIAKLDESKAVYVCEKYMLFSSYGKHEDLTKEKRHLRAVALREINSVHGVVPRGTISGYMNSEDDLGIHDEDWLFIYDTGDGFEGADGGLVIWNRKEYHNCLYYTRDWIDRGYEISDKEEERRREERKELELASYYEYQKERRKAN